MYQVMYSDGTSGRIHPSDIYSNDEHLMRRLKLQAKRGLDKYEREKKIINVL